jgi:hypothetical protein
VQKYLTFGGVGYHRLRGREREKEKDPVNLYTNNITYRTQSVKVWYTVVGQGPTLTGNVPLNIVDITST